MGVVDRSAAAPARAAAKEGPSEPLLKILMLGDSSVGKSSLVSRFCENRFETAFMLTVGVDFKKKVVTVDGRRFKLQIWDTAGQERFRTITPAYFRSAMGVVLVYDISNAETFRNVRYWMTNLAEFGGRGVRSVLVGNKADLLQTRAVRQQYGRQLAAEYGVPFVEASAKSGLGVREVFMSLATDIVRGLQPPLRGMPAAAGEAPRRAVVGRASPAAGLQAATGGAEEQDAGLNLTCDLPQPAAGRSCCSG